MWVKICANTNLNDALLAAELGADALGFVFAPSRRQVTAAQVSTITPHLPSSVEKIGVFLGHSPEEIVAIAREASLDAAQLHGELDLSLLARLREILGDDFGLIQTLHWRADQTGGEAQWSCFEVERQLEMIRSSGLVDRILIDSRVGAASGGTGVPFDWKAAGNTLHQHGSSLRIIAAGGLNADNVVQAIQTMHPWGVDVATGVEAAPGEKSPDKLAQFLKAALSPSAQ